MSLSDHDKDSVGRLIQWLYTRKFKLTVPVSVETSEECYMQLAKLNTLADKYDDYLLKNHIIDELFDLMKPPRNVQPPTMPLIAHVYDNTTRGSSFRKVLVAWYVYGIDLGWYDKESTRSHLARTSRDFAIDLAMELGTRLKCPSRISPYTLPSSVYHETPPKKTEKDGA